VSPGENAPLYLKLKIIKKEEKKEKVLLRTKFYFLIKIDL